MLLFIAKLLITCIKCIFKSKFRLTLEVLAKDQQLAVYAKTNKSPKITPNDRKFWVALSSVWSDWADSIRIVKPETVLKWHKKTFKWFWWLKAKPRGRPKIDWDLIKLIRKISRENSDWGNLRIKDELRFLGTEASVNTIKKYRPKQAKPPSQTWKTFMKNHLDSTISIDMFTVPSVTFGVLYGFVVLNHARRKILFTAATYSPHGSWIGQQIINTFFDEDESKIKYLIRDRDRNYNEDFRSRVFGLDIEEVITAPRSPWQNAFCERVIGSIRRECLNHIIILGECHLRKILKKYADFYNNCRPHQGKGMQHDAPISRKIMKSGEIITERHLGGLQNCYKRAA
jgi:hypothetical protein